MNCQHVQNHLLSLQRPDAPPLDLRRHLTSCAVCRAWQERLLQTEAKVRQVPAPAPRRKLEFLQQFALEPVDGARPILRLPEVPGAHPAVPRKERGLQKLSLAVALAASLVFFALGWWLWPRTNGPDYSSAPVGTESQDTLLATRLKNDARWQAAATPKTKLEVLATVADEVHGETATLIRSGRLDELSAQACLYREVIQDGILKQAEDLNLPSGERYLLLTTLAQRLEATGAQADATAETTPAAATALHEIAQAARAGNVKLRQLAARS